MEKEREKIRDLTGPKNGFKPAKEMIAEINEHLRGWKNYYRIGYCRREFRDVDWAVTQAIRDHLQRRSQRGYRRPKGLSWYRFIRHLGFAPL